jgi:hypothetical protein
VNVPDDLRLIEEFLNTLDRRRFRLHGVDLTGSDALPTPAALVEWLAGHGLIAPSEPASEADLKQAHELRSLLRDVVTPDSPTQAGSALAAYPMQVELDPAGGLRLAPPATGVPGALGRLVAMAVQHSAGGSWRRLRACASEECRWVFYDDSRNGAGRWCSMSACGNRTKTARYRARQAG